MTESQITHGKVDLQRGEHVGVDGRRILLGGAGP
jgi:hypothetical protein